MGKISLHGDVRGRLSLRQSFAFYMISCLLAAFILSMTSMAVCQFGQRQIYQKYERRYEEEQEQVGHIMLDNGMTAGGPIYVYKMDIRSYYTDAEKVLDQMLVIISFVLIPVWFVVSISVTSILFYRRKLEKPLTILDRAAERIADNDLNFKVSYGQRDDLGRLCESFEKMRLALQENNLEMWRQMEERRRLNAAFSHDMRTPLSVLKGQSELLMKYVPEGKLSSEKIMNAAGTMNRHIIRLENYVNTMNSLQRLEDIEIKKEPCSVKELLNRLQESGRMIAEGKEFIFRSEDMDMEMETAEVDAAVVMRIYENLLSNAVRYANSRIIVTVSGKNAFSIMVEDDGQGFSEANLEKASEPFFRASGVGESGHFGMGLYICRVLCEKHGGCLILANNGGASVKAVL